MLLIKNLIITQDGLRNLDQIKNMVEAVKQGHFWTRDFLISYSTKNDKPSPLIQISKLEDDKFYLHDGTHRTAATLMAGRDYLRDDEYQIKNFTYNDYLEVNFGNFWVTPIDLRTEIRKANFFEFKNKALELKNLYGDVFAKNWIFENSSMFKGTRKYNLISELITKFNSKFDK